VASKAFVKPETSVTPHENKNVIPAPARRTGIIFITFQLSLIHIS
jgi:hypothetical protein